MTTDARTLDVALTAGGTQRVTFDGAIIATGFTVRLLPGVELSAQFPLYGHAAELTDDWRTVRPMRQAPAAFSHRLRLAADASSPTSSGRRVPAPRP